MNLIEAIRSGRPIRRRGWPYWYKPRGYEENNLYYRDDGSFDVALKVCPMDGLADDWETQERAVTITRTQFQDAFLETMRWWENESRPTFTRFDAHLRSPERFLDELARALGLEDKP